MLYSFSILSWNNNPEETFFIEASDLLDAHMKAISWVDKLDAALDAIPTCSSTRRRADIRSVVLQPYTALANESSIASYVNDIKESINRHNTSFTDD
jgi:hypothetical protein